MIRKHISHPFAELITHALITSRLDTCNSLLHSLNKTPLKRLQRLQNTAVRLVTLYRKFTHITPTLKQIHWLPSEQRTIFKMSVFVFKTIHGASPIYLCSLVKPYEPLRGNIRSANKLLLTEYKSKNWWGARSFTVSAAKAWNTLPNNIRASATIRVFKTALKTHLFKAYFE